MVVEIARQTQADPNAAQAVIDAIRNRRSIGKVLPDMPPRAAIEALIEAATWAPNHHMTEPWRFFVLTGAAREGLGDAMVRAKEAEAARDNTSTNPAKLEALRQKPLRAPVVIAIAVEPDKGSKAPEVEEVCAGAAAVQNMLLAAHSLGLAAIWRTGDAAFAPEVREFFGLSTDAHLLGFVYLGYPASPAPERDRTPANQLTDWYGWGE